MSTYWDIHCRTCDAGAGFSVNHGEEQLLRLLNYRAAWAGLVNARDINIEMRLLGDENGALRDWPRFAHKHLDHELALRNEYGAFLGECSRPVRCPFCLSHLKCNLKVDHAGECRRLDRRV